MKYKLIASDLDGTLLGSDAEITEENLRAIKEITARGVLFVPVTGRAMYESPKSVVECEDIRYFISSNGAVVYDKLTGEKITHCFTAEKFREIYALLKSFKTTLTIHCDLTSMSDVNKTTDAAFDYYHINDYYRRHIRTTNVLMNGFDEYFSLPREVEMISVFFRHEEELRMCRAALEAMGDIDITASVKGNLEIIRHGALKGAALTRLTQKLDLSLNEVIAVGDSKNDISMLEISGLGLAASNALEKVKAAAHKVICSNDDNVARYILENYVK